MPTKLPISHTKRSNFYKHKSFTGTETVTAGKKPSTLRRQRSSSRDDDLLQPLLVLMIPQDSNSRRGQQNASHAHYHGYSPFSLVRTRRHLCHCCPLFCNKSHFKLKLLIATLLGLLALQYVWHRKPLNDGGKFLPQDGSAVAAPSFFNLWAWLGKSGQSESEPMLKHTMYTESFTRRIKFASTALTTPIYNESLNVFIPNISGAVLRVPMVNIGNFDWKVERTVHLNNNTMLKHTSDSKSKIAADLAQNGTNCTLLTNATSWHGASKFSGQNSSLPVCAMVPPVLVGPIKVWFDYPSWPELRKIYPNIESGGHGKPTDCLSRSRVALILPYRDRDKQLRAFLHNLHSLLTKQQLDYAIFVIEQVANQTFNRAKLFNVGFTEATKLYNWQCAIFHDVDLFPEDDRNFYTCPEQPRHMSVAVDKFNYNLPYSDIFGGISALTVEQFEKVNGFSNDYWGWGGEDDDMASRVKIHGYKISRYPKDIARYKMIKHVNEKENPINKCRFSLMYKVQRRWRHDGLTTLNYVVQSVKLEPLFTRITVDLLEVESRSRLDEEKICK